MTQEKKLYKKLNKNVTFNSYYTEYFGVKKRYSYDRNSKKNKNENEVTHSGFKKKKPTNSYDYTPLYKFLLKSVGGNWNSIFQYCQNKLNDTEPITKMVINVNKRGLVIDNSFDRRNNFPPIFHAGPNTIFSLLFVDDNDILRFVDENCKINKSQYYNESLTFNGKRVPMTKF